ncbi:hypothetical protein ElyMa_003545400 [Elysia marginata]|uniref:Uncharacterized protein n=1 Tax=Elysia marginata TaxID=1093978 RepID=A0AAV4EIT2_9GAST|nr:hypothetical protein ElyMa_003545400 [Elysia marginata]
MARYVATDLGGSFKQSRRRLSLPGPMVLTQKSPSLPLTTPTDSVKCLIMKNGQTRCYNLQKSQRGLYTRPRQVPQLCNLKMRISDISSAKALKF